MIETSQPPAVMRRIGGVGGAHHNEPTNKISKSHSVDSMCSQQQHQIETSTTPSSYYDARKSSALVASKTGSQLNGNLDRPVTEIPATNGGGTGRFINFRPAGLRKKVADSKNQPTNATTTTTTTTGSKPGANDRNNKLNRLKKQTAQSSYDLKALSSTPTSISSSERKSVGGASMFGGPNMSGGDLATAAGSERAPPLSLMQKLLLDEQKIYSDPNDNYKRRTVVLVRPKTGASSSVHLNRSISQYGGIGANNQQHLNNHHHHHQGGEFGFNLQAYGFLNKLTQQTEYICFVRNVEANSPASRAGLQSGDVLLAIDGVCLNEFRSFAEITSHVHGKNELRLVLMAENVSKRIQCQLRAEQIRRILVDKRAQLEKVNAQAEEIMKKYGVNYSLTPTIVQMNASTTSTPGDNNSSTSSSSSSSASESKCSSDGLSLTNSTSSSLSAPSFRGANSSIQHANEVLLNNNNNSSCCDSTNLINNSNNDSTASKDTQSVVGNTAGHLMINESTIFMSPPPSLSATNMYINQSLMSASEVASSDDVALVSSLSQSSSFSSSTTASGPTGPGSSHSSGPTAVTSSTTQKQQPELSNSIENSSTNNNNNRSGGASSGSQNVQKGRKVEIKLSSANSKQQQLQPNHQAPVTMILMKSSTPVVVETSSSSNNNTSHHLDKTPSSIIQNYQSQSSSSSSSSSTDSMRQSSAELNGVGVCGGAGVKIINASGMFKQQQHQQTQPQPQQQKQAQTQQQQQQQQQSTTNGKTTSLARKYFESTSRLVRSASSSSMNLFSSLKSSLSSNNLNKVTITQQPGASSSDTLRKKSGSINYSPSFSALNKMANNTNRNNSSSSSTTTTTRHSISTDNDSSSVYSSSSRGGAGPNGGAATTGNSIIEQIISRSRKSSGKMKKPYLVNNSSSTEV